ncbi:hypothetical protein J2TS4_06420 [Paenibacillus sp. J2TS4]|nr:hypothetical protein J2TS4_06420 [Paenibacillus sp. J2TS4]
MVEETEEHSENIVITTDQAIGNINKLEMDPKWWEGRAPR